MCFKSNNKTFGGKLHLSPVRFVHQEDLAPDLDPGGLPLRAPPPGEAGQGLVLIAQPAIRRLSTAGSEGGTSAGAADTPENMNGAVIRHTIFKQKSLKP